MSLRLLFVTGKLAETALRRTLAELAPRAGFDYDVAVLPITVAALATTPWIARHLSVPDGVDRVVLPGLCAGDLAPVQALTAAPVERGPNDLRDLPDFFRAAPLAQSITALTTSPFSPKSTTLRVCRARICWPRRGRCTRTAPT